MTSIIECDYKDEDIRKRILAKYSTYKDMMISAGHYLPFVIDQNLEYVDIKIRLYSKDKNFQLPNVYDEIISIESDRFDISFLRENQCVTVKNCFAESFPRLVMCLFPFQKLSISSDKEYLDITARSYCTEKRKEMYSPEYEAKVNRDIIDFQIYYNSGAVYKV